MRIRAGLAWPVPAALVAAEAAHETVGLPGPAMLYDGWLHGAVIAAAAAICLARATSRRNGRGAWLAFGMGLACWATGTGLWSLLYGDAPDPPYPSVADILWLLWYPLTGLGIALLIRAQVGGFELHRWMDGLAVMLLVLAAAFPLMLEPADEYLGQRPLAAIVDLSYPILDMLLLGAILGVLGLMAWRPGKVWLMLGCGGVTMAIADAAYAVQHARGTATASHCDFLWAAGALLIAGAAWVDATGSHEHRQLRGLEAIALPLAAQLLAVALQVCIVLVPSFDTQTHRIVVLAVLIIATIQVILARPRHERRQPPEQPPANAVTTFAARDTSDQEGVRCETDSRTYAL